MSIEDRLLDLEVRITYQESTIQDLNDVIVRQQHQIDSLVEHSKRLKQQLENQGSAVRPLSEETPPPHY